MTPAQLWVSVKKQKIISFQKSYKQNVLVFTLATVKKKSYHWAGLPGTVKDGINKLKQWLKYYSNRCDNHSLRAFKLRCDMSRKDNSCCDLLGFKLNCIEEKISPWGSPARTLSKSENKKYSVSKSTGLGLLTWTSLSHYIVHSVVFCLCVCEAVKRTDRCNVYQGFYSGPGDWFHFWRQRWYGCIELCKAGIQKNTKHTCK